MRCCATPALAGVLAGALAVAGCGVSSSSDSSRSGPAKLVLIERASTGDFFPALVCGARAEAHQFGDSLSIRGPAGVSAARQIVIINSVIATKPDAVLIASDGREALAASIQSMKSAGIKVVQVGARRGAREARREGVDDVRQAVAALEGTPPGAIRTVAAENC